MSCLRFRGRNVHCSCGVHRWVDQGAADESAFLRFQLALALAARPESRAEGIRWLRYGFDFQPLYLPLTYLALGRSYEAAGQRDSAVQAYGRFLRLVPQAWIRSCSEG